MFLKFTSIFLIFFESRLTFVSFSKMCFKFWQKIFKKLIIVYCLTFKHNTLKNILQFS